MEDEEIQECNYEDNCTCGLGTPSINVVTVEMIFILDLVDKISVQKFIKLLNSSAIMLEPPIYLLIQLSMLAPSILRLISPFYLGKSRTE